MRKVEEAMGSEELDLMRPVFLVKNGAKINSILQMLQEFKATTKNVPEMVVIVGLIGDILEKKRDDNVGWPLMRVKKEEWMSGKYPAVEGALQMRKEIEEELNKMWAGVKIIWVLPFPIDLATYVKSCTNKEIPRQVEFEINQQTLHFNDYMSTMDKVFQKVQKDNVIPWFPLWKDATYRTFLSAPEEYKDFMARIRMGKRVPPLYPEASLDGLHPNYRVAQALIRVLLRKYVRREKVVEHVPVPVVTFKEQSTQTESCIFAPASRDQASQTERTTSVLIYREQASQTENKIILVKSGPRGSNVISSSELPCGHEGWDYLKEEHAFSCVSCGGFFPIKDLVREETMIQRNVLKIRSKPQ